MLPVTRPTSRWSLRSLTGCNFCYLSIPQNINLNQFKDYLRDPDTYQTIPMDSPSPITDPPIFELIKIPEANNRIGIIALGSLLMISSLKRKK